MASVPQTIEFRAVQMLEKAGHLWDDSLFAFRRTRRVGSETTEQYLKSDPRVVAFEELDNHGLVLHAQTNGVYLTQEGRGVGLQWLANRIHEDSSS